MVSLKKKKICQGQRGSHESNCMIHCEYKKMLFTALSSKTLGCSIVLIYTVVFLAI